jgi:hypothetical protein
VSVADHVSGWVNVRSYGAKGDGVTDDTAAIQEAFNSGAKRIIVPPATYRVDGNLYIGSQDGTARSYIEVLAEGAIFLKPAVSTLNDWILAVDGLGHRIHGLRLQGEPKVGTASGWSADIGLHLHGYPQTNALGGTLSVTKNGQFDQIIVEQVGTGVQLGNWDVDAKDPDIESNTFRDLEIRKCNVGLFNNGQNVLHNPILSLHVWDCRDRLIHQRRGSTVEVRGGYLGSLRDHLSGAVSSANTNSKVLIEDGSLIIEGMRSEDNAMVGLGTGRTTIEVTSTVISSLVISHMNFTVPNGNDQRSIYLHPLSSSDRKTAVIIGCEVNGWIELEGINVVGIGNTLRGTVGGVANVGIKRSGNQTTAGYNEFWNGSTLSDSLLALASLTARGVSGEDAVAILTAGARLHLGPGTNGDYLYSDGSGRVIAGGTFGVVGGLISVEGPNTPGSLRGSANDGATAIGAKTYNRNALTAPGSLIHGFMASNGSTVLAAVDYRGGIEPGKPDGTGAAGPRIYMGTATPIAGAFVVGDRVLNSAPAVGSPKGWACTVAGTPGTWVSEGNL